MENPNYDVVDEQLADDEEMEAQLPGFRFHPTDEELVGFYLRRKVVNKPLTIELIKSIDIYKYDPLDLPKTSCTVGEKEWYFFCKRGRKYKNSIRPNRVTGSGFWKATGIDKPVHNSQQNHKLLGNPNNMNIDQCIGLKKTLVYYRGSAGKGTKTDWMMHEFRLPAFNNNNTNIRTNSPNIDTLKEAEIWTLCRIFKRNVTYRKYTSDWRELSTKRSQQNMDTTSPKKHCNSDESNSNNNNIISANNNNYYNKSEANSYIDFSAVPLIFHEEEKPNITNHHLMINMNDSKSIVASDHHHPRYHDRTNSQVLHVSQLSSLATTTTHINSNINNLDSSLSRISSLLFTDDENDHQLFSSTTYNTNCDELRAVVEYAFDPALM